MKKFYSSIEEILFSSDLLINQLKSMRELLAEELRSDNFKLACIEELLDGMKTSIDSEWQQPDFFYHQQLNSQSA